MDDFESKNPDIKVKLISGPYSSTRDQIVIGAASGAVAHDEDAVVEVRATQAGDHAGGVQLEGLLVGLDRDGHLVEVQGVWF